MHRYRVPVLLIATALCAPAFAHPGHGDTLAVGLLHPLSGIDHLLATLGVGIWASMQAGRTRWLIPASFIALMIVGAWIAVAGHAPLVTELGVAASVAAIGMLIFRSVRVAPVVAMLLAGSFAVFHGFAHGSEMSATGALPFGAGFLLSSAALQLAGFWAGMLTRRNGRIATMGGAAIAACGALLMMQTL